MIAQADNRLISIRKLGNWPLNVFEATHIIYASFEIKSKEYNWTAYFNKREVSFKKMRLEANKVIKETIRRLV